MSGRILVAGVVLSFLAGDLAAAQSSLDADKAAVSSAMDAGSAALRNRDWAAYARFWANSPDIEVLHPAAREWIVGWDSIAAKYRAVIADTTVSYEFTTLRRNVHVAPRRDMAWGTDETRITMTRGARTSAFVQWSTFVFERQGEHWRLVHAHASVPPTPRPPAP